MGQYLAGPVWDKKRIPLAGLNLSLLAQGRFDFDVTGPFACPDVFQLVIDTVKKTNVIKRHIMPGFQASKSLAIKYLPFNSNFSQFDLQPTLPFLILSQARSVLLKEPDILTVMLINFQHFIEKPLVCGKIIADYEFYSLS